MGTQPVAHGAITARWTERLKGQAADVQRITSDFDEVSAVYALFGPFYVGLRCPPSRLAALLEGEVPVAG